MFNDATANKKCRGREEERARTTNPTEALNVSTCLLSRNASIIYDSPFSESNLKAA